MIKKILQKEDPALHKVCHPVTNFDRKLSVLIDDLVDTLEDAQGLGLAAPQVGILRRVVIVMDDDETFLELVNPEIVSQEGEQEGFEGCLSLSGLYGIVKRPMKVKVKAQDRHGNWFEVEGEELFAQAMLHENGHLDGEVFKEDKSFRPLSEEELEEMNSGD